MNKTSQISPRELLEKAGYKIYADEDVLKNAPMGESQTIEWFTLNRRVTCAELEKEYADRGLEPANLNTLIASYDVHPYAVTIWKDAGGKWCYAAFSGWRDGRDVSVRRSDVGWLDYWSFAGRRKSTSASEPQSDLGALELRLSRVEEILKHLNLHD